MWCVGWHLLSRRREPLFGGGAAADCPPLPLFTAREIALDELLPGRRRVALTLRRKQPPDGGGGGPSDVIASDVADFLVRPPRAGGDGGDEGDDAVDIMAVTSATGWAARQQNHAQRAAYFDSVYEARGAARAG